MNIENKTKINFELDTQDLIKMNPSLILAL